MTRCCYICNELRSDIDCIIINENAICKFCYIYYSPKKHDKKLKDCQIFTLDPTLGINPLIQWGQALEKKKYLLLDIDKRKKKYTTLINQSKKSFKNLSETQRDKIILQHPTRPFTTYKEYINHLE